MLALVNAIYLEASWQDAFHDNATADGLFTRVNGSEVTVPMMHGASSASAQGDG